MSTVAIIIMILVIAVFAVAAYLLYKKYKPADDATNSNEKLVDGGASMMKLHTKIAEKEARGEVQGNDFEVFIISEGEFSRKANQIEEWMLSRFEDKNGHFTDYSGGRKELSEFQYVTDDKVYDIFFLVVDKTAEDIIPEPIPEPEPTTDIVKVEGLEVSTGEQAEKDYANTRILREQFKEDGKVYVLPKGEFYAYGMLPDDPADRAYRNDDGEMVDVITGEYGGTINLKDVSNVAVVGSGDNDTTLFTVKPAVEEYYPNAHSRRILSKRKFIEFTNSKFPFIYNIGVRSNNTERKYVYPFEFEHGIDADKSQFVHIEKFRAKNIWGDGIYLRGCSDVYIRDVIIDTNGRQGGALISGSRGYLEKYVVLDSDRSGFDIEGNTINNDSKDFVITYSYFNNKLKGLPMGGRGFVKNVLSINNIYRGSPIWSKGDGKDRQRENIMFVRNKARELGDYEYTDNVLIDGVEQDGLGYNKLIFGQIDHCTNVTIRNCDLPNYGRRSRSEEPFFYIWSKGTPLSEFKIYNNKQKIGVILGDEETLEFSELERDKWYRAVGVENANPADFFEEEYSEIVRNPKEGAQLKEGQEMRFQLFYFPEYTPTEEEAKSIPFETSDWMEMQWDRLYTNGHGWREENYVDDGWRPEWVKENYKRIGL